MYIWLLITETDCNIIMSRERERVNRKRAKQRETEIRRQLLTTTECVLYFLLLLMLMMMWLIFLVVVVMLVVCERQRLGDR